jgi:hypothetical protein
MDTGKKKKFGVMTLIMVLLTSGVWLLAMPFYPNRCVICGREEENLSEWVGRISGKTEGKSNVGVQGFFDRMREEIDKEDTPQDIKEHEERKSLSVSRKEHLLYL